MSRTTNARIAGFTFLFYIAVAITNMVLSSQATSGATIAAKLVSVAQHAFQLRLTILFGLFETLCAIVLAVTLFSITRDEEPHLALLALIFRTGEGLIGTMAFRTPLELLWLAAPGTTAQLSPAAVEALGTQIFQAPHGNLDAIFFAFGSTLFSYLLLRGRMIPMPLAWLGVAASLLLVIVLPLQLAGLLHGSITSFVWIPMLAYEGPLGFWLMIKGVPAQSSRQVRSAVKA
jgi:hypothetical protein